MTPAVDTSAPVRLAPESGLAPIVRAVAARRVLVLLVTLGAVAASVLAVALRSPEYKARAELLINPLPQEDQTFLGVRLLRDSGDPTLTAKTAAALIKSQQAARRTARRLGGGWTPERVLQSIEVKPQGQSNLLDVNAKAERPDEAARLANVFVTESLDARRTELQLQAEQVLERLRAKLPDVDPTTEAGAGFVQSIDRVENVASGHDPTLDFSERATPPGSAGGAPAVLIVLLAAILGFTLAAATALVLERVDRRLRDEVGVLDTYALPVLARVPTLKHRELRHNRAAPWTMSPAVREAFRTLLVQLTEQGESGGVIMLTSASSGDGKTTSSLNLAVSIAAAGHECILLDFDLRKPDVGPLLDVSSGVELAALLRPDTRLKDLLVPVAGAPKLWVLPTTATEGDVVLVDAINRRLPELIGEAQAIAAYVVIDTAPLGEVSDALRVAGAADDVVVVVRPGSTHRGSFEVMRDLLERVGDPPSGILMIGGSDGLSRSYYGSGAAHRDLYLEPRRNPLARMRSR